MTKTAADDTVRASITSYAMPEAADFPASQVKWSPQADRSVLLVHDMQSYFLNFYPTGGLRELLVDRVASLIEQARNCGVPVAYTMQPGDMTPRQRGLIADFWGPGMSATEE